MPPGEVHLQEPEGVLRTWKVQEKNMTRGVKNSRGEEREG